jgi:flagellar hook-length control protein FliK
LQGTKIQPQTPVAQVQLADPNAPNLATVEALRQTEVSADSPRPTKLPAAQRATPTTKPEDVLSLEVKAIRQVANVQSGDQDSLAGLANGAASTVAAHRSSAPEGPATTGATGQPSQVPVADQITDSLRESTIRVGQQITIRLNPPELGAVRLTLQSDGKEIHGTLQVDNHRVLGELQHQAASLMNRLAEDGIQMRKLDISLNDRGPTDSGQGFQQHAGSPYKDPQPWAENLPVSRSLLAEASPPEPETVVQAGPPSDSSLVNVMI